MKGTVWQRCTRCSRKVDGRQARQQHRASGCDGAATAWAYRVDLGRDADGSRQRVTRSGFGSKAEAERELRATLTKVEGGRYIEPTRRTLSNYLGEWLEATAPPRVAHSTAAKRRLHVERYISPNIGAVPLTDVNGASLDRLYATLLRQGKVDGSGLAASTVNDVARTLHRAFADARRWQYVDRNPAEDADPPRLDRVTQDARAVMHVWTPQQLRTFLAMTAEHRLHAAWHVAAHTGMRRSELLALRWTDLDLDAGTATVRRKLVTGEHGYELIDATKTAAGGRMISLDPTTVSVLVDQGVRQLELRDQLGNGYQDHGLVFARPDGSPLAPPALTQAFRRAVAHCMTCAAPLDTVHRRDKHAASGCVGGPLPTIRLHDLRHTHATILLQRGTPVKTVSRRLGHASPVVTMTIYSHLLPGDDQAAAASFAALLAEDED